MTHQHPADLKHMGLQKEFSAESEKDRSDAMEFYCYLCNTLDYLANGQILNKNRFDAPSNGPIIPFGTEESHNPSPKGTHIVRISLATTCCQA